MKSPLITMSAITGSPTKGEIHNYLKSLKKNGIDQIMLYPRSGCELEYLSDYWFEKIGEFLDFAKQLDMAVWIYDEFNWPSGDAGGRVTEIEDFRLKAITVKGESIGKISCQSKHNSSLFGEKFFPDLLSEKAVDYFIKCTHEKYFEKFGSLFGKVIKGFFTDEPSIGYCCSETSIPYYYGIEDDYKKQYGSNFNEDMQGSYNTFCKNAITLISEQFNKCFIKKINNWCTKHGVLMTGHLMGDDFPATSIKHSGNFLKNLSSFSLPGIDEIWTPFTEKEFNERGVLSLLGGAEYASGEQGAMAELFALGPCDMTYATKRCMIFLSACFKIDRYFLAVSPMDMRGNAKITDYFNCFTADQPDFSGTVLLSEGAKTAAEYAKKDFTPDVYVKYPTDICAAGITDNIDTSSFVHIINRLSAYQLQWKYISEGDDCGDIPVIAFNDKMEYVFNGTVTPDAEAICNMLPKSITVTDINGEPPVGLFVRRFNDNTAIVLNLFGKPGIYIIDGKAVELDTCGVYITTAVPVNTSAFKRKAVFANFNINYCNDNILRAMLVKPGVPSEIHTDSISNIYFAVRKDTCAYLSSTKIKCTNAESCLPNGFKNLYNISVPIKQSEGIHILSTDNDYRYLPSVFIMGDFSAQVSPENCAITLKERKHTYNCGEYFSDFGKIEFTADITVPAAAKALELKGTELYTCVYADSMLLGEKICSPYIFEIDEQLQNKSITLKITQYSSLAPIFSDIYYYEANDTNAQWLGTPKPGKTIFGFSKINWIY